MNTEYQILCTVREVSVGEALDWLADQLDYEFRSGDTITRIEQFQMVKSRGLFYVAATCTVEVPSSTIEKAEDEALPLEQIDVVGDYILAEIPGEPSRNEGPGRTAVRLLRQYRLTLETIMSELGVPDENYPSPVANAYHAAKTALGIQE